MKFLSLPAKNIGFQIEFEHLNKNENEQTKSN
jgi:hypothetical protein